MNRARRTDYYPRGDLDGRRRPRRVFFRYDYVPFDRYDVRPFDILLSRARSFESAAIVFFSQSDGKSAWLSHAGQVMADGKTVSEALFPEHSYTPIDDYFRAQAEGRERMTLVRIREEVWPDPGLREKARDACESYHLSCAGQQYQVVKGLLPMMVVSILRNSNPFLKRGAWEHIPEEKATEIFICSAIIDYGWAWAQRALNRDFFPSTLSLAVPSPQDVYESPAVEFVAGWKKVYYERRS